MGSALLSQWVNGPEAITVVDPAGSDVPDGVALVTDRSEIADDQFDCIIAATALRFDSALATANIEDFRPFSSAGLELFEA